MKNLMILLCLSIGLSTPVWAKAPVDTENLLIKTARNNEIVFNEKESLDVQTLACNKEMVCRPVSADIVPMFDVLKIEKISTGNYRFSQMTNMELVGDLKTSVTFTSQIGDSKQEVVKKTVVKAKNPKKQNFVLAKVKIGKRYYYRRYSKIEYRKLIARRQLRQRQNYLARNQRRAAKQQQQLQTAAVSKDTVAKNVSPVPQKNIPQTTTPQAVIPQVVAPTPTPSPSRVSVPKTETWSVATVNPSATITPTPGPSPTPSKTLSPEAAQTRKMESAYTPTKATQDSTMSDFWNMGAPPLFGLVVLSLGWLFVSIRRLFRRPVILGVMQFMLMFIFAGLLLSPVELSPAAGVLTGFCVAITLALLVVMMIWGVIKLASEHPYDHESKIRAQTAYLQLFGWFSEWWHHRKARWAYQREHSHQGRAHSLLRMLGITSGIIGMIVFGYAIAHSQTLPVAPKIEQVQKGKDGIIAVYRINFKKPLFDKMNSFAIGKDFVKRPLSGDLYEAKEKWQLGETAIEVARKYDVQIFTLGDSAIIEIWAARNLDGETLVAISNQLNQAVSAAFNLRKVNRENTYSARVSKPKQ